MLYVRKGGAAVLNQALKKQYSQVRHLGPQPSLSRTKLGPKLHHFANLNPAAVKASSSVPSRFMSTKPPSENDPRSPSWMDWLKNSSFVKMMIFGPSTTVTHGFEHNSSYEKSGTTATVTIPDIKRVGPGKMSDFLGEFEQRALTDGCTKIVLHLKEVINERFESQEYWAKHGYSATVHVLPPDFHGSEGASPVEVLAEKTLKTEDPKKAE